MLHACTLARHENTRSVNRYIQASASGNAREWKSARVRVETCECEWKRARVRVETRASRTSVEAGTCINAR